MTDPRSARFHNLPTAQLEELLRRPDLPQPDRWAIQTELTRRYTGDLGASAGQPMAHPPPSPPSQPARPQPPPAQPAQPPPVQPPSARPLQPANRSPSPSSAVAKIAGALVLIVVLIATALFLFDGDDDATPPTPDSGTTCAVFGGGSCPLQAALPVGSPCFCTDGFSEFSGVVQ